jgi:hypothetical protein
MKKTSIFDILFIISLTIALCLLNELGRKEIPIQFLFIPFLGVYYTGKYLSALSYKKKV